MSKDVIREKVRRVRREIGKEERSERSRKAQAAILSLNEYRCAKSVMLYYPTAEKVILNLGSTSKRLTSGDRALDKILCTPLLWHKQNF